MSRSLQTRTSGTDLGLDPAAQQKHAGERACRPGLPLPCVRRDLSPPAPQIMIHAMARQQRHCSGVSHACTACSHRRSPARAKQRRSHLRHNAGRLFAEARSHHRHVIRLVHRKCRKQRLQPATPRSAAAVRVAAGCKKSRHPALARAGSVCSRYARHAQRISWRLALPYSLMLVPIHTNAAAHHPDS